MSNKYTDTKSTIITEEEDKKFKSNVEPHLPKGFGGTHLQEMVPEPLYSDVEKMRWKSGYNSFITMGKDRHAGRYSGAGGFGETQCGMIDLVAGRVASVLINNPEMLQDNNEGGRMLVANNWFADAARVYISQKSKNVDKYLGFNNDTHNVLDLSTVVIKSDCTRIVGRESVRIYTGSSKTGEGLGKDGELRANGTPIQSPKIELIGGGNDEDLQPAVLGKNLVKFLIENNRIISENSRAVVNQMMIQITTLAGQLAVISLGSTSAIAAKTAVDNISNIMSGITDGLNEKINNINYLDEGIVPGNLSILSNKVYIT
jgi:hypothetical protein